MGTVAQTLGPEAMLKFINPSEAIQRLAAAQGIDVLNLIKTPEQLEQDKQMMMQQQTQQELVKQTGQLAGTPLMDPSKNPQIAEQAQAAISGFMPDEAPPPPQE
tara:strand:- start:2020 stop:2331 length:312 start_codon:yes stop_codon:yes gene_type:complete